MTYSELEKTLRPISWLDNIRASIFTCPATFSSNYCSVVSDEINSFIDNGAAISEVDPYEIKLKNSQGKTITLWCANFPYSYGNITSEGIKYICKYPSWQVVLKIRKLQLEKRDEILQQFIDEHKL